LSPYALRAGALDIFETIPRTFSEMIHLYLLAARFDGLPCDLS